MSEELVRFLRKHFEERKAKNARYSLRAFARLLEMDSSTLSAILSGRRKVSLKQVARVLRKLGVEDSDVQLRFVAAAAGIPLGKPEREYVEVDQKIFAAMRDWEHSAIMAAFDVDPTLEESRLAHLLDLPVSRVHRSMTRLQELGMLVPTGAGWKSSTPHQTVAPAIPSRALRDCHRQYIEKALESLEHDEMEIRDISGITMSFDAKKMAEVKAVIRDFRRKVVELAGTGTANSVYRMNVQLFPITKGAIK